MPTFRADCARCAALCCVALAFDRSESFAFDKKAGEACRYLDTCGRCMVHAERKTRGLSGCVRYDCHGAGQFVTQELFAGRSWQSEPALRAPMVEAFFAFQRIFEMLALLSVASTFALPSKERTTLESLATGLRRAVLDCRDQTARTRAVGLAEEAMQFLRTLAPKLRADHGTACFDGPPSESSHAVS